jgi:hypothetical protein
MTKQELKCKIEDYIEQEMEAGQDDIWEISCRIVDNVLMEYDEEILREFVKHVDKKDADDDPWSYTTEELINDFIKSRGEQ